MKIVDLKYIILKGKLRSPLKSALLNLTDRSCVIIKIGTDEGFVGYGEASPLQGFSSETIEDVINALQEIQKVITSNEFIDFDDLKSAGNFPSLKFAFGQALHMMTFNSNVQNLKTISANCLVSSLSKEKTLDDIYGKIKLGFDTFKLKLGVNDFSEDLDLLTAIRSKFPNLTLRVDLNGTWDYNEALININSLEKFDIQYIEQPVSNLDELISLSVNCKVKIAPDESIKSPEIAQKAFNNPSIDFVVIKPGNIGFYETIEIIKMAEEKNKYVVISSMYESDVGRSAIIYLASLINHDYAHGLSESIDITGKIPVELYAVVNGKIDFDSNTYPPVKILQTFYE